MDISAKGGRVVNQALLWSGAVVSALAGATAIFSQTNGSMMASPSAAVTDTSLWVGIGGVVAALTGLVRVWRSPDAKIAEVRLKEYIERNMELSKVAEARLKDSADRHAEVAKFLNDTILALKDEIVRLREENAIMLRSMRAEDKKSKE